LAESPPYQTLTTPTAAVLNVTVPSVLDGPGHLTDYPQGTALPMASNLNWMRGEIVANTVTVGVSSSQEMTSTHHKIS